VFTGEKCDPKILERTATPVELSGLLNWALEGLRRLLKNRHFSTTENMEELRSNYIRKSNSSRAFIEEELAYDQDPKAIVPEAELYERYVYFCRTNNLPSTRKAILTQNIHRFLPQVKQTMERLDGKSVHVWQFIQVREAVTTVTSLLTSHTQKNLRSLIHSHV
jgi:putative DNA primase/helicase